MTTNLSDNQDNRKELENAVLLGVLAATASAIQIAESPLPRILPWLKPGLSNALILYGVVRISPLFALQIVILRTFLTGFFLGLLFSPANILSLIGGTSAVIIMSVCFRLAGGIFSIYGISIMGAVANNLSQLASLEVMFGGRVPFWMHFAVMIWVSIPSGLIVAALANELLRRTAR